MKNKNAINQVHIIHLKKFVITFYLYSQMLIYSYKNKLTLYFFYFNFTWEKIYKSSKICRRKDKFLYKTTNNTRINLLVIRETDILVNKKIIILYLKNNTKIKIKYKCTKP